MRFRRRPDDATCREVPLALQAYLTVRKQVQSVLSMAKLAPRVRRKRTPRGVGRRPPAKGSGPRKPGRAHAGRRFRWSAACLLAPPAGFEPATHGLGISLGVCRLAHLAQRAWSGRMTPRGVVEK